MQIRELGSNYKDVVHTWRRLTVSCWSSTCTSLRWRSWQASLTQSTPRRMWMWTSTTLCWTCWLLIRHRTRCRMSLWSWPHLVRQTRLHYSCLFATENRRTKFKEKMQFFFWQFINKAVFYLSKYINKWSEKCTTVARKVTKWNKSSLWVSHLTP